MGVVAASTNDQGWTETGLNTVAVIFRDGPLDHIPNVSWGITAFDTRGDEQRASVDVQDVTMSGFNMIMGTWSDQNHVVALTVSWIAV
jgi:hypothetical protein